MVGYLTPSDKKSIYAASSTSGNSAPLLEFVEDDRYISFNDDETIVITAGTYSLPVYIKASDAQPFLTNININLSSSGFVFEPSEVFLSLGDDNGTFRVGADSGLLPINYFYNTTKTEEVTTYYTITKGNNIQVTNIPVTVTVNSSIDVPIGGCSEPIIVDIVKPPFTDLSVSYNYDNFLYDEDTFWPNPKVSNSELTYNSTVTKNSLSFCADSSMTTGSFPLRLVLGGTDYRSYIFSPSENVTINIISSGVVLTPQISFVVANRQRTFVEFNITTNTDGNVYYHYQLGQDMEPINEVDLKVRVKSHEDVIESMDDFMNDRIYTDDRDEQVGHMIERAGTTQFTRFENLLPQRWYTFCFYLENHYDEISSSVCQNVQTRDWGKIMKASVTFSQPPISDENLNKVLCFFTKEIDTEVFYLLDLESNSCYDRAVSNVYYNYSGDTFSAENHHTIIYMVTNPYLISDPSPTAFQNMFGDDKHLTVVAKSSAVSGFAINYMSVTYRDSFEAIDMIDRV